MDYDYYEELEKLYEIFGVQISRLLIYCFKKGVVEYGNQKYLL